MEELKAGFPDGVEYQIAYDITPYIRDSVRDVVRTLIEAIGLVAIVVLVFLQSWRAALIPLLAVPVAVLGTFVVMAGLGFSLNNISLFGLVLAIGIVVDDAIVVVENVERWMDRGLAARAATYKAMDEVTGPIVAVALVLCAVFVPCAFIRGITGQFFRQFAVTIAVSTIISTVNSLTFSPAMAAIFLRPRHERPDPLGRLLNLTFGWLFWVFNRASGAGTAVYAWATGWMMRLAVIVLAVYVGLLGLTGWTFDQAPKGFIPQQDQGRLIVNIQLPDAASLDRTHECALEIERIARETPGVGHTVTNSGMSFLLQSNSSNFASMFIVLDSFEERNKERFKVTPKALAQLGAPEPTPTEAVLAQTRLGRALVDLAGRDEPVPEEVLAKLKPLGKGKPLFRDEFMAELARLLAPDEMEKYHEIVLKRARLELKDTAIMAELRRRWAREVPEAQVTVFGAAPVPGLGSAGGFKFMVEDRGGLGVRSLEQRMDDLVLGFKKLGTFKITEDGTLPQLRKEKVPETVLLKLAALKDHMYTWQGLEEAVGKLLDKDEKQFQRLILDAAENAPILADAKTQFRSRIPQLYLEVDRIKAASMGVSLGDLNQTVSMYLGSLYVNSYNDFGRHWQVTAQAAGAFRARPEQIHLFQVRNSSGQMIPLSTLVKVRDLAGPITVTRYNLYTAAPINGNVLPGVSDGDAIKAINAEADSSLPLSMRVEWTELMYMQLRAGNTAIYVFMLSVVSVFLALAALYESWTLPLAVILVVPLCLLCSVAGVLYAGKDVNIFVQIGLVVLVGLACKNAILIVEFAKHLHTEGMTCFEATREASRLRLRPIVMTSFAFIFGVLPLMYAHGAGAEMRRSLGVAVFSGMLGVTLFGIFLTPVFFHVIQGVSEARQFRSPRLRWALSHAAGAGLGAVLGFLLARLGAVPMPWGPIVGGCAGLLLIRGIRGFQARIAALPRTLMPFARKPRFGRGARVAPPAAAGDTHLVTGGTVEGTAPAPLSRTGEPNP
ncbi:RND efflux system, inner membrane transporter [Frigoriglobus tundricola]|uniref:RND efflux system, inner membrane transporter n=2 Tax=Frigoriglobus tundricola TaxID=2774151 RepID=A0A6M5Z175_9BACT|nr:RND efflux system, inner membrane transporter [Frigoriglobus tundricola]